MIETGYIMSEVIFSIREEEELFTGEFLYLETLVILLVINKEKRDERTGHIYVYKNSRCLLNKNYRAIY